MATHLALIEEVCRLRRDLIACQEDRTQFIRLYGHTRDELQRVRADNKVMAMMPRELGVVRPENCSGWHFVGTEKGRLLPEGPGDTWRHLARESPRTRSRQSTQRDRRTPQRSSRSHSRVASCTVMGVSPLKDQAFYSKRFSPNRRKLLQYTGNLIVHVLGFTLWRFAGYDLSELSARVADGMDHIP